MRLSARRAEALLDELGHHDTLDLSESHSRSSASGAAARLLHYDFTPGLGLRRTFSFRAVRWERLQEILKGLEKASGPEALALRGRVKRLLGDVYGAKTDLRGSLAAEPSARASGWLGELTLYKDPEEALPLLEQASRLDPAWPWPRLWLGIIRLNGRTREAALDQWAAFEALSLQAKAPPCYLLPYLRWHAYFDLRRLDEARREAQAAIALDPTLPAGHILASRERYASGDERGADEAGSRARNCDMDAAGTYLKFKNFDVEVNWTDVHAFLGLLDRAIQEQPNEGLLYAERAELRRDPRLCMYEEALADYRKAAELLPGSAWVAAVLGRAKNNLRGGRAGIEEFDRAISLCPASGWILAWRGAARARVGEAEEALEDFNLSERLMPWHSFTYAWRGALYNRLGRHAEARRDLDTAIRLDPYYNFSYNERFRARAALKDYLGAVEDLNRASQSDPKYSWLGAARPEPGKPPKALRELDQAVKKHPNEPWLLAWRGQTRQQLGLAAEAERDLGRALELEPDNALMHAWRGSARRELGRAEEARQDLEAAVKLDPKLWTAHRGLAELHAERGELKEALACMETVVRLVPTTVSCLMGKALLEQQLGRNEAALKDLTTAVQLDPGYALGWAALARVQLACGDPAKAEASAEKALAAADPPGLAFLVRGLLRQKKGDFKGQIEDFKKALQIAPELFPEPQRKAVRELIEGGARV